MVRLPQASVRLRDVGAGPVILMTPDCPSVIEHYRPIQDRLAERCRVICFDLPGFGLSTPEPGYDFSVGHGARLVLDLLDALELQSATLAFSCANGFYAMAAAQAAPERCERLVLAQTPSGDAMRLWGDRQVPFPVRIPVLGQALLRLGRSPAVRFWYRRAVAEGRDPTFLVEPALDVLRAGGAYLLADMVQGLGSTRDEELEHRAPLTLVWGMKDRSHPEQPAASARAHNPAAEVVRFADCGHFPDLEAPARYVELLLEKVLG